MNRYRLSAAARSADVGRVGSVSAPPRNWVNFAASLSRGKEPVRSPLSIVGVGGQWALISKIVTIYIDLWSYVDYLCATSSRTRRNPHRQIVGDNELGSSPVSTSKAARILAEEWIKDGVMENTIGDGIA